MAIQGRKRRVGGAVVLLLLGGAGLPNIQAQAPARGESPPAPSGVSGEGAQAAYYNARTPRGAPTQQRASASPAARTPSLLSPDHDLAYPLGYPPILVPVVSSVVEGPPPPIAPPAGELLFGIPAAVFPWNRSGFVGYDEPPVNPRDSALFRPDKYSLKAAPLAADRPIARPEGALLIARLPANALLWVEGRLTRLRGPIRYFESPPLIPGERYSYTVRAVWVEDGRWVSQTQKIPVQAGLVQAVYLRPR